MRFPLASLRLSSRGKTILACQAITAVLLVGLGLLLETVSPGWWERTTQAFSQLAEINPYQSEPTSTIHILPHSHDLLPDSKPHDQEHEKAFKSTQLFHLSSRPVLRAALANSRISRLELVAGWPEKERINRMATALRVRTDAESSHLITVQFELGTREEKAAIINAVIDSYESLILNNGKKREGDQSNVLQTNLENLKRRWTSLAKLSLSETSIERIEQTVLARLIERITEEIEIRKVNRDSPDRVVIIDRAG